MKTSRITTLTQVRYPQGNIGKRTRASTRRVVSVAAGRMRGMSAVSDFLTEPGFWWGVPLGAVALAAPHVRQLVSRGGHPAHRHRGAYGSPRREDDADRLRAPDQHRRPHGQHGRPRRVGDADDQGRQRDPAAR